MTLEDKWLAYCDPLPSPDNFIKWGYHYLIAAALQRRVWCPPDNERMYANMYVTLVGKPGVGKGGVIRRVSDLLKEHKLKDFTSVKEEVNDEAKQMANTADELSKQAAEEAAKKRGYVMDDLLIPVAADTVTYEALVQSMARSIRYISYTHTNEDGSKKSKVYGHSSLCFCLEEKASLFRKNTESIVNFLIQAYDAGEDYEYQTKTAGTDRIRRVCLNFLAGTTPDFMQSTFDEKLIGQGYSSRTFYIFALKNRKSVMFREELTPEQKEYRKEISAHIKKLAGLYGCVQLDDETKKFMKEWWQGYENDPSKWASKSTKLEPYYSRKNIHVMKLAMAKHFGRTTDMHIPLGVFQEAIEDLHKEEKTMHLALNMGGNNPLAQTGQKIAGYLMTAGKKTFVELLVEFNHQVKRADLEEVLSVLRDTGQIGVTTEADPDTKKVSEFYSFKGRL